MLVFLIVRIIAYAFLIAVAIYALTKPIISNSGSLTTKNTANNKTYTINISGDINFDNTNYFITMINNQSNEGKTLPYSYNEIQTFQTVLYASYIIITILTGLALITLLLNFRLINNIIGLILCIYSIFTFIYLIIQVSNPPSDLMFTSEDVNKLFRPVKFEPSIMNLSITNYTTPTILLLTGLALVITAELLSNNFFLLLGKNLINQIKKINLKTT